MDLADNRLVYSDDEELVLADVSDPVNVTELDRIQVGSEIRDIDFDGSKVAVGLGGNGVVLFNLVDDRLVEHDSALPPEVSFHCP